MNKLIHIGKYILALLVCPKQCAQIANEVETVEEMDRRIMLL
jgi:hypothetical protein